jgi:hypothetical protein
MVFHHASASFGVAGLSAARQRARGFILSPGVGGWPGLSALDERAFVRSGPGPDDDHGIRLRALEEFLPRGGAHDLIALHPLGGGCGRQERRGQRERKDKGLHGKLLQTEFVS